MEEIDLDLGRNPDVLADSNKENEPYDWMSHSFWNSFNTSPTRARCSSSPTVFPNVDQQN